MADDLMEMESTDLGAVEPADDFEDSPDTDMPDEGEESEPVEGEEDTEESAEEEEAPEETEKAEEVAVQDGRKLPDFAKKGIAALKNSNPKAAKYFRAVHFQNVDYKAAVGTPADAIALKNQWEEIGGADGVAMIQEERKEWGEVDKAVAEGRAAELLSHDPEMLVKNAVGVINEFAKTAPDQYGYYQNLVTANKLESLGMQSSLAQLHSYLKEADPEAAKYVAALHDKIVDVREQAMKYEQKRTDPREDQLKQKETAFEEKRRADFETQVESDAYSYRDHAIDKAITVLLNGRKADDDQMKHYRKLVKEEVEERFDKVPNLEANLEAHYRTGNKENSVGYIKKQYDRILGMGKAADVIAPLLRNINPTKATVANTQNGKPASKGTDTPGIVNVSSAPSWDQVNWEKTSTVDYASGRAVLTNGKQARWGQR